MQDRLEHLKQEYIKNADKPVFVFEGRVMILGYAYYALMHRLGEKEAQRLPQPKKYTKQEIQEAAKEIETQIAITDSKVAYEMYEKNREKVAFVADNNSIFICLTLYWSVMAAHREYPDQIPKPNPPLVRDDESIIELMRKSIGEITQ